MKKKLKTSEFFRRRRIIIEREEQENAEIKVAIVAILGRLAEQKDEAEKSKSENNYEQNRTV